MRRRTRRTGTQRKAKKRTAKKRKRHKVVPGMLTEVIEELGGIPATAVAAKDLRGKHLRGPAPRLPAPGACVRLAQVLAPDDPVRQLTLIKQLAGIPD